MGDPDVSDDRASPYDICACALEYAAAGYRVLPCHSRGANGLCTCQKQNCSAVGKHPRTRKGVKEATSDEATIRAWWQKWPDANVGIAGGGPQRLVILDVDGEQGLASLGGRELPRTATAHTPRGRHYFFEAAEPWGTGRIPNEVGFLPGLDLRGDDGYVIAPPSVHASGRRYCWQPGSNAGRPLAQTPAWLSPGEVAACKAEPRRRLGGDTGHASRELAEGSRNAGLCSLGGAMRRQGAGETEIQAALGVANRERCAEPLADDEVRAIARSVCKYPAGARAPSVMARARAEAPPEDDGPDTFAQTDVGNAEAIVRRHGHELRWNVDTGKWHQWTGTHWAEDRLKKVDELVIETLRERRDGALKSVGEVAEKLVKWARSSENDGRLEACKRRLSAWPGIAVRGEEFDADPWLFNCPNGVVDLRTMEIGRHDPARMCSRIAGAELSYEAFSPLWAELVQRVTCGRGGLRDFLARALGYSMTGLVREHCFFTCYGSGANGKSTFIEAACAALGDYALHTTTETFLQRDQSGGSNDLARLEGARLVVASEADEGRRLSEATVKSVTGGEGIVARFLYREYHEFKPQFKLFLATNHKPRIYGTDHGMWRRVRLVPFDAVIPDEEQDAELGEKLLTELAGVLGWIAAGCLQWVRDGLGESAEVREATAEYRAAEDLLGAFFEECLRTVPTSRIGSEDVYKAYLSWAEAAGERPMSRRRLSNMVAERGYRNGMLHEAGKQKRCWHALSFTEAGRERAGAGALTLTRMQDGP